GLQLDPAGALERATDERHVVLEVVRLDEGVGPEAFDQCLLRLQAPRALDEEEQRVERLPRERDLGTVPQQPALVGLEAERTEAVDGTCHARREPRGPRA